MILDTEENCKDQQHDEMEEDVTIVYTTPEKAPSLRDRDLQRKASEKYYKEQKRLLNRMKLTNKANRSSSSACSSSESNKSVISLTPLSKLLKSQFLTPVDSTNKRSNFATISVIRKSVISPQRYRALAPKVQQSDLPLSCQNFECNHSLNLHKRNVAKELVCEICSSTFVNEIHRALHYRVYHEDVTPNRT